MNGYYVAIWVSYAAIVAGCIALCFWLRRRR